MLFSKHGLINLFHIIIVVPFLLYVYYTYITKQISPTLCEILFYIGLFGFISHIFLFRSKVEENKDCYLCWANLIHIFLVFPLFMWIGYNCKETKRYFYEMLLLITLAALGYHLQGFIRYELLKDKTPLDKTPLDKTPLEKTFLKI